MTARLLLLASVAARGGAATLVWRVVAPPSPQWGVRVHIDGRDGRLTQADHEPAICGTRGWKAGDVIVDRFEISPVADHAGAGSFKVYVGWFVAVSGAWKNASVAPAADDDRFLAAEGRIVPR